MILKPGTPAPAFTLNSTPDQTVSLADFRGQPRHPGVLPGRLEPGLRRPDDALQRGPSEFHQHNAALLGISVDGAWCHHAFAAARTSALPAAGRLRAQGRGGTERTAPIGRRKASAERALFVIDGQGMIHWSYLSPIGVNPGADGILDALESLPAPPVPPDRRRSWQSDNPAHPAWCCR